MMGCGCGVGVALRLVTRKVFGYWESPSQRFGATSDQRPHRAPRHPALLQEAADVVVDPAQQHR